MLPAEKYCVAGKTTGNNLSAAGFSVRHPAWIAGRISDYFCVESIALDFDLSAVILRMTEAFEATGSVSVAYGQYI
ncbi:MULTISPECIES: hypothetical protein [Methylocaldum]|uniref:hypothetical protein n=1 Tax=unclassified Methylocaldum TaxID=2622260 RepID=UPI000A3259EB|nr:hypothetical protein [Methylocaldum sp. RMAD-M]MBP1151473.1 hypothetical protein [Methylocaldum sp. RMAD-M]MVF22634.1 hypothetical protein [Methylocaldum sp. BRCS4]